MEIGHDHHVPRYIYILIVIMFVVVGLCVYMFGNVFTGVNDQTLVTDGRMTREELNTQSQVQLSPAEAARRQALIAEQRLQIKTTKLSTAEAKRRQATLEEQLAQNRK